MRSGFARAEQEFTEKNYQAMVDGVQRPMILDKSGSCALVVLIVGDMCYIANVGDSRAILSAGGATTYGLNKPVIQGTPSVFPLSKDHKPSDEAEKKRIIEGGGQIYQ